MRLKAVKFKQEGYMKFRKSIFVLSVCAFLVCASAAQGGYIDNLDGTVTDNGTGLMWQQATTPDNYTWEQALAYCENLEFANYTDWRLPTVKELASIVDTTRVSPAINTTYFPDTATYSYWTSTTYAFYFEYMPLKPDYAWSVHFDIGNVRTVSKTNYWVRVRAVRAGQSGSFDNLTLWPVPDTGQTYCFDNDTGITCPQSGQPFYGQDANYSINTPAYTKLAAGCTPLPDNATTVAMVRDDVTGLIWEEKDFTEGVNYTNPNNGYNTYSWYDSNPETNGGYAGKAGSGTDTEDFINALNTANYGGYSDWRLPTVKELQTIVDYNLDDDAFNNGYFYIAIPEVPFRYWSSTSDVYSSSQNAWEVDFATGLVSSYSKENLYYVRAVRSGQCGSIDTSTTTTTIASTTTTTAAASTTTTTTAVSTTTTTTAASSTTTVGATTTTTISSGSSTTTSVNAATTTTTTTGGGKPCPARQVLGDANPKLEQIRNFRDSSLAQSSVGRKIIQIYYNNADSINAALERSPALRAATRKVLEIIAPMLGRKEQ